MAYRPVKRLETMETRWELMTCAVHLLRRAGVGVFAVLISGQTNAKFIRPLPGGLA